MKKIIIIDASPRKNGNSDVAAERMAAALQGNEVKIIKLREANIKPCIACDFCKKQDKAACVQRDDFAALIHDLDDCDAIALMTPIYFGQIPGPAKTFIDRCYAFFNPAKNYISVATKRGKKAAVIGFCGSGPVEVYSKYLGDTAQNFGVLGVDATRVFMLGNVNEPGSCTKSDSCMNKIDETAKWLID